jgi:hypothetical protein
MDIYRILKNFDAVNSKQALDEGSIKQMLHKKAESMSKADFIAYVTGPESRSMTMSAKEAAEFWINCNGEDDEELDEATKSKEKEKKPPFPGSPEYEKKYGKPKHDDDSAFHKKKVSTGTVYSRKHKEEPEVDDEDDKKPKKKGRPTGVKKKIGAKGPSVKSKLLTGKNKGGLKEHDHEHGMEMHMHNGPDSGEYDDEAGMARQDLHTVVDAAKELHDILASDENLPEWVQAKITKALDYIDTSRDYVKSSHADQGEQRQVAEALPPGEFKPGDRVLYMNKFATIIAQDGDAYGIRIDGKPGTMMVPVSQIKKPSYDEGVAEASDDQLDQQKMSQMKRAAAARANSRRVQQQPPSGGPRRSDIPAGIRKARGDAPLGRDEMGEAAKWRDPDREGKTWARDDASTPNDPRPGKIPLTKTGKRDVNAWADKGTGTASDPLAWKAAQKKSAGKLTPSDVKFGTKKNFTDEMGETSMGGTVAGGIAPAPGAKTFAETSSGSHEIAWKAAAKAVNAIMKKRGYAGSKTDEGYMWTRKTPRGTAFVDIDFDERWPNEVRWGEGELKGAKRKDYYQSGNDNVRDLAQVIGELFANVKLGQSSMDEADEDGKKDKPGFGKKKPDDDGDGVPDWADKKPGSDDNEESDDSEESDDESDDDKELKLMKSRAGVEDKDDDSDDKESDDDSEDDDSDDKPEKGKKPDFGKSDDEESDEDDSDDEDDDKESDDDSDKEDKPKKDTSGTPYGKSVYESAFKKSLNSQLNESINMNTSQDSDGKKSVTVTASDEDADKLGELLKMAGLFSSEGYSSVCQNCGGIHEANACGADHVDEDLANSPDEVYTDADYMTQTLSGGLNGPKNDQTTNPIVKLDRVAGQIEEAAKTRLWNMYKQYDKK